MPSSSIDRPMTSGDAPKRRRHSPSLMTIGGDSPASSSPGTNVRPSCADTPSTENAFGVTRTVGTRSGSPPAERFICWLYSASATPSKQPHARRYS